MDLRIDYIAMIHIRLCALDIIHHAAFNKLESTLPNAFIARSQVHLQVRSQVHSRACSQGRSQLDSMTLPACLTIRSQVSSQDAPKHTPGHALKDAPNCTRWRTPSLLDCTLPSKLSRRSQAHSRACSQVHSQEARHSQSHLTICSHVCSWVLDPDTCWVAGARHW